MLKITLPTCDFGDGTVGEPFRTVGLQTETGLRVILDEDGTDTEYASDLLIERHPGQWVVYVHPDGSDGDPVCAVIITDDKVTIKNGAGEVIGTHDRH